MNLSIQFKKKEILNTDNITLSKLGVIFLNDLSFTIIIFIWYQLFSFEIITSTNPFFILNISLIHSIVIFVYLFKNNISMENIIKYFIILVIFKIFPLISLYLYDKAYVNYIDVYYTIYLYLIYILLFLIIYDIILEKNLNIDHVLYKDLKTNLDVEKDESIMSSIYDVAYHDIIKRIFE